MDRWENRVAVVTGASAGIGAAICKLLCRHGMKVVGCARRVEKVQELIDRDGCKQLYPYKCDLSNSEEVCHMFEWIENNPNLGKVDVCIANAGMAYDNSLLEGTVTEWKQMLDINVIALNQCTQLAIKSMLKHNIDDGHVIMVNGMAGHRISGTWTLFYGATKFAVTGLLEGWRQEVRSLGNNNNIRISQLSPGIVETEFAQVMYNGDREKANQIFSSFKCMETVDMANSIKYMLEQPTHVQVHDILVRPTQQSM